LATRLTLPSAPPSPRASCGVGKCPFWKAIPSIAAIANTKLIGVLMKKQKVGVIDLKIITTGLLAL
jgi:hypothetical protein